MGEDGTRVLGGVLGDAVTFVLSWGLVGVLGVSGRVLGGWGGS